MDFESAIIAGFNNKFIGDDAAVIGKLTLSKDLFCENTHFKRGWLKPKQLAYKSMIVNISDAIAMNASPVYALLGLGIRAEEKMEFIRQLQSGFKQACNEFDCQIIGGDTIKSNELSISISIIGKLNSKKPLQRRGLKKGHLIAHTGTLGSSLTGLKALLRGGKARKSSRFMHPVLRDKFIRLAGDNLACGMDISDGLSRDLSRLSKINNLGIKFIKAKQKKELKSGEEYEMLVAFDPRKKHKIIRMAQKSRTKLSIFAKAVRGRYVYKGKGEHF